MADSNRTEIDETIKSVYFGNGSMVNEPGEAVENAQTGVDVQRQDSDKATNGPSTDGSSAATSNEPVHSREEHRMLRSYKRRLSEPGSSNGESTEAPAKLPKVQLQTKQHSDDRRNVCGSNLVEMYRQFRIYLLNKYDVSHKCVSDWKFIRMEVDNKRVEVTNELNIRVTFPEEKVVEITCNTLLTIPSFEDFLSRVSSKSINFEYFDSQGEKIEGPIGCPTLGSKEIGSIRQWSSGRQAEAVLVEKCGYQIKQSDINRLVGANKPEDLHLNDSIINVFFELLAERSKKESNFPDVCIMNTQFLTKLVTSDYSGVETWTKKVDIFEHDIVLVPIHKEGIQPKLNHWALAVIDFRRKTIKVYDSLTNEDAPTSFDVCKKLYKWLKDECLHKKSKKGYLGIGEDWIMGEVRDIPQQENGSDCGVFCCMYAEFITRNRPILFTQQNMEYFRKKMVYEIRSGRMLN